MKWLSANLGTLVMALLLSVLTWTLLYSEKTNTIVASATFNPTIRADVGSVRFRIVDGADLRTLDKLSVEVTGPRAQIEVITRNLVCAPVLEDSFFPAAKMGEVELTLSRKDFGLPETVSVRAPTLKVSYAKYEEVTLPIKAGPADIDDRPKAGFRVERLRVDPATIKVRIPANRVSEIKELPIKPIRVTSRTESFPVRGLINTDAVGGDVQPLQEFTIEVIITAVPFTREISSIVLHLSSPPLPGRELALDTPRVIKVQLEGPQELVQSVQSDQLHAYVRINLKPDVEPGSYLQPVFCDLVDDHLRATIKVTPMPDDKPENREAKVIVTRKP